MHVTLNQEQLSKLLSIVWETAQNPANDQRDVWLAVCRERDEGNPAGLDHDTEYMTHVWQEDEVNKA